MSSTTKVVILLMFVVLIGLPLAGQLMKSTPDSATVDETAASQGSQPSPQSWRPPQQPRPQGRPNQGQRGRQAGQQPPMLNAQNLVNSVWEIQGARVTLLSGGKLKATHPAIPVPIDGTWSVRGATLTVSAMGKTETAQIVGHDVVASGTSIRRIQ